MTSGVERIEEHRRSRTPLWRRLAESWAAGCACGQITVVFPNDESVVFRGAEPGPPATIELHRRRAVWRMLIRGDLGLAEGYIAGDWSTPDLAALIAFGVCNEKALSQKMKGTWLARMFAALRFRLQANSRAGSRRNIAYHYDLGNDFYAEWLDETMTYSSAMFARPGLTLAEAQCEKYRQIVEAIEIRPGDRVLEIGCGWGGFAEYAAKEAGACLTSVTISGEQASYARQRMAMAGVDDRVEVRLEDYRDIRGVYDKIVSIEMLEAVGEANWSVYFRTIRDRLVDGGRALLQVITVPDERFQTYRRRVDFIQRYIFPGGMLPSPGAIAASAAEAGLELADIRSFGAGYAETLFHWNERFQARWEHIRQLGFDDRFRRLWTYYLNSCEACFRAGATDVGHFVIVKPDP